MCGIVGYIGKENASEVLIEGLRRLEYRGYDSAGLVVAKGGALHLRRAVGKLNSLQQLLLREPLQGSAGLGHTRWATHGKPSEDNAHPHQDCRGRLAVVHNGIVENYASLKADLAKQGHKFTSQTDTEVIAHLIEEALKEGPVTEDSFAAAVRESLQKIHGSYALGIVHVDLPSFIIGARKDSPLVLGVCRDEYILASDVPAVLHKTRDVVALAEGEMVVISPQGYKVFDVQTGSKVEKKAVQVTWDAVQAEKSGYRHFMLKEIHEQPRTIEDTLRGRLDLDDWKLYIENIHLTSEKVKNLRKCVIAACGTSWHAGLIGRYLIEKWIKAPCEVEIASEYRYRDPLIGPGDLLVAISQSGQTADTLAAMRHAKKMGAHTIAVTNVAGSTMAEEADGRILTHCGPEIGVASTKAFTAQLAVLTLMTLYGALARGTVRREEAQRTLDDLLLLPGLITEVLKKEEEIAAMAKKLCRQQDFLYLGRHLNYPIALEGALKLKEISYIHAEGYPAGELKHGPIALIDENMPVVAIATHSSVYEKVVSNVEEIKARGGIILSLATEGDSRVASHSDHTVFMPKMPEFLAPLVNVVPLQILAYYIAVARGCDVDQPRNLAKSVTVE